VTTEILKIPVEKTLAVAVDDRDAGGADPPDEPEADHAEVPPQPVPAERHAGDPAVPLQVPRHQRVPRRHPAAPHEACDATIDRALHITL